MQDQSQGRLVAVVVTFNRLEKLQHTIDRLLSAPAEHLAVLLVVDNASTDGTADWLAAYSDPRLDVLTCDINLGGAGGFEAGLRHAAEAMTPDWIVVMDDDAYPEPGALAAFHAHPRGGFAAWAAAVRYPDGRICDMNRPWTNPFWHARVFLRTLARGRDGFHLGAEAYDADGPQAIDGGSFVGLFLSRAAIQMAGYPDPRLFLYGDDVLYTLGLTRAGGRIAFDPAIRFDHDCTTLSADGGSLIRPLWKAYYFHRNQLLVYRRAAGPLLFWPVAVLKVLAWRLRARHYGADRAAYLKVLSHAVKDGLAGRLDRSHADVLAIVSPATGSPDDSGAKAARPKQ